MGQEREPTPTQLRRQRARLCLELIRDNVITPARRELRATPDDDTKKEIEDSIARYEGTARQFSDFDRLAEERVRLQHRYQTAEAAACLIHLSIDAEEVEHREQARDLVFHIGPKLFPGVDTPPDGAAALALAGEAVKGINTALTDVETIEWDTLGGDIDVLEESLFEDELNDEELRRLIITLSAEVDELIHTHRDEDGFLEKDVEGKVYGVLRAIYQLEQVREFLAIRELEMVEEGEPWLDQQREIGYKKLADAFASAKEKDEQDGGDTRLAFYLINRPEGSDYVEINKDILDSAELQYLVSPSASTIAGKEIRRPVVVFHTDREFQRFYAVYVQKFGKTISPEAVNSRGFTAGVLIDVDGTPIEVQVIVAAPNGETIGHEIRHSIDPHLETRRGYDQIISELFAYYQDEVVAVEAKYSSSDQLHWNRWDALRASVWATTGSYYRTFTRSADKEIAFDAYGKLVNQAVDAIKRIDASLQGLDDDERHVQVHRRLVQMQTLDELLAA